MTAGSWGQFQGIWASVTRRSGDSVGFPPKVFGFGRAAFGCITGSEGRYPLLIVVYIINAMPLL